MAKLYYCVCILFTALGTFITALVFADTVMQDSPRYEFLIITTMCLCVFYISVRDLILSD